MSDSIDSERAFAKAALTLNNSVDDGVRKLDDDTNSKKRKKEEGPEDFSMWLVPLRMKSASKTRWWTRLRFCIEFFLPIGELAPRRPYDALTAALASIIASKFFGRIRGIAPTLTYDAWTAAPISHHTQ